MNANKRNIPSGRRFADALTVDAEVLTHYQSLLPDMLKFYRAGAYKLPDPELMIAIDKEFGSRLTTEVCEPLGFFQGACVFIGAVLLRQHNGIQDLSC